MSGVCKPSKKNENRHRGFTLFEFIIYLAIASLILVAVVSINFNVIREGARSSARADVERNFSLVWHLLQTEVRAAQNIDAAGSSFDMNPGRLKLVMKNGSINPTLFETVSENFGRRLVLLQGSPPPATPTVLTSDTVTVDKLLFFNRSAPDDSTRNLEFALRVRHINPDNLPELNYSLEATTSIELMNR